MKNSPQKAKFAVSLSLIFTTLAILYGCKKANNISPRTANNAVIIKKDTVIKLNLSYLKSDGGYCYKLAYTLNWSGDSNEYPELSTMRVYEDTLELGPGHTEHQEIRDLGRGRFSHWGNALYFSSSDNTDPVINRRKYTCRIQLIK